MKRRYHYYTEHCIVCFSLWFFPDVAFSLGLKIPLWQRGI